MTGFVTVSATTRPPEDTFRYIVDLTQWSTFRGYGPLPGIVSASVVDGGAMALGARVRVTNTDGSVHHEVVEEFVPGRRYRIRMELGSPAHLVLARVDETVDLEASDAGTRVTRRFDVIPRNGFTAPIAWFVATVLLRRAVDAHNAAVADALRS